MRITLGIKEKLVVTVFLVIGFFGAVAAPGAELGETISVTR